MAIPTVALPGQILGPTSKYIPGTGTHLHNSHICASLAGIVSQSPTISLAQSNGTKSTTQSQVPNLPTISIASTNSSIQTTDTTPEPTLPTVSSLTLCRITRLSPRHATCALLTTSGSSTKNPTTPLPPGITGLIRVQDIRATEKDTVTVSSSFRIGDIVRAEVISLGDGANYYLSTARNELGVLVAWSESGNLLCPRSWRDMVDCVSGVAEGRKVARPD